MHVHGWRQGRQGRAREEEEKVEVEEEGISGPTAECVDTKALV